VHLKHLLSQIQTNRASLVHGRLRLGDLNAAPWHIDAVAGASTPSLPSKSRSRRASSETPVHNPGLMPQEKAPSSGALLPALLMYFCSGQLMHFCSGSCCAASSEAGCSPPSGYSPPQR
jgi:hypothetical protein